MSLISLLEKVLGPTTAHRQRDEAIEAARAGLGRYGAETAGQIGPMLISENPGLRQAGLQAYLQLQERGQQLNPPPLTEFQGRSLANEEQRIALAQRAQDLREWELRNSLQYRTEALQLSRQRLGLSDRPTPTQGGMLAEAEYGVDSLRELISMARPEYFGFVSENYGDAVAEVRSRLGTAEDFTAFWNLLDNLRIEINSGRMSGILSNQDVKLLNEVWANRTMAPEVAMRAMGNLLGIMEDKLGVARNAVQYSGRSLPEQGPERPPLGDILGP